MNWEKARDKRTNDEVVADYNFGKINEIIVFENINLPKFWIDNKDELGKVSEYKPDCFMLIKNRWFPVEIKYTSVNLKYIELKKNQCDKLTKINGLYLQATPLGYVIVSAKLLKKSPLVENSYCNKPCYRYTPNKWNKWNKKISFFKK